MVDEKHVRLYLEEPLRESAQAGAHNFINLMVSTLEKALFRVEYCDISGLKNHAGGPSITHMKEPPDDDGLVFRRVYHYPFWQIEQTSKRWHWDVAKAEFDSGLDAPDAARFYGFWQKRLFGSATSQTRRDGFVYVPLQGRVTRHRVFQSCSPVQMIEHCLECDPKRKIIATLHPKETYSRSDMADLYALEARHSRLTIGSGDMVHHLQGCDYVVTQNSSAAFAGYFFGKPALLFAKADFHHIAENATIEGLRQSFDGVLRRKPAYDKYIWWFWQQQSINAGHDDAKAKIEARFRRFDWIK